MNTNIALMMKETSSIYKTKMLGIVTLYNPDPMEVVNNIKRYIDDVDTLIIWDNSPLEVMLKQQILDHLTEIHRIIWHGDGKNHCIAPAINYAWHYAEENDFQSLLLMDQDSEWIDFSAYRKEVETLMEDSNPAVYTPYVNGTDQFAITSMIQTKRLFINSGAIIPTVILGAIGGIDEICFPLDAIDHDMAYSISERGYKIICLTSHHLNHSLGEPQRMGLFHIFTPNYNSFRTYSMTRSHIICYRKHRKQMTKEDKDYLYREIIWRKFCRIILAEPEKMSRLIALIKGIINGYSYKI